MNKSSFNGISKEHFYIYISEQSKLPLIRSNFIDTYFLILFLYFKRKATLPMKIFNLKI